MVVKALSDPNHDREMEVKIDGSHFVTFSIAHDAENKKGAHLMRRNMKDMSLKRL